jgi:hypothetical protein
MLAKAHKAITNGLVIGEEVRESNAVGDGIDGV